VVTPLKENKEGRVAAVVVTPETEAGIILGVFLLAVAVIALILQALMLQELAALWGEGLEVR
tara:strand:- start:50 stop:235 length:186 start_codon:yes stop_codon:yes gene_type:complete